MARTVLLRHTLDDGSSHLDWLLEPDHGTGDHLEDRILIAFRIAEEDRPDAAESPRSIPAVRLAPHRRHYLRYEGPISGGRGRVDRLAAGVCELGEHSGDLEFRTQFPGTPPRRWRARPESSPLPPTTPDAHPWTVSLA